MESSNHFDAQGAARMVDISTKPVTERKARASGRIRMAHQTCTQIRKQQFAKGDVLAVARLAGIMAAKQTSSLIPLCHPLSLERVEIDFAFSQEPDSDDAWVQIEASAAVAGRTGVEMEALVAVSGAALTIYDMCKSVDRGMVIETIRLDEKVGGRSGHFKRAED
jgi:cyclic pyranopterin phosphate synthase